MQSHSGHRHRSTVQELRSKLRQLQCDVRVQSREAGVVSTGIPSLDDILPDRGLRRGTLSEWIAAEPGSGAAALALSVAGQAQHAGPLIIVDGRRRLYAGAFPAAGVSLEDTILVRPESKADELWAVEQALRCSGIGAVLCVIERLRTQQFRRLQLAAESGTAVGLLIRPLAAFRQPGWADVRLLAAPKSSSPHEFCRRVELRCLYAKGGLCDRTVELGVRDETGLVYLAADLLSSASALSAAGAEISGIRVVREVG